MKGEGYRYGEKNTHAPAGYFSAGRLQPRRDCDELFRKASCCVQAGFPAGAAEQPARAEAVQPAEGQERRQSDDIALQYRHRPGTCL
ncbi:hypothetical protein D3C74_477640 [compost metagenome]